MSFPMILLALTMAPAILAAPSRNCLLFCDDEFPTAVSGFGAPAQPRNAGYNAGYNTGYYNQPSRQQPYYQPPRSSRLENFGGGDMINMMQQVEGRPNVDMDGMLMHSSSQSSNSQTQGFLRLQSRPRPAEPIRQRPCANDYVDPCM